MKIILGNIIKKIDLLLKDKMYIYIINEQRINQKLLIKSQTRS